MSTSITNISDFVEIKDEEVYTTSRIVAEKFGKRHAHIIRDIEATVSTINEAQVIENKAQPNFGLSENIDGLKNQPVKNDYFVESSYIDSTGRTLKEYLITEDGLALLVMGFTGVDAMRVKLKFVAEFNRMKNIINNPEQVIANCGNAEAITAYGIQMTKIGRMMTETANNLCLIEKQRDKAEDEVKTLVHDDENTYTATDIAKDLGFRSAIAFNQWLKDIGFQYKQGKHWVVKAKYAVERLLNIKLKDTGNGFNVKTMQFTNKGKLWITEKYRETHPKVLEIEYM